MYNRSSKAVVSLVFFFLLAVRFRALFSKEGGKRFGLPIRERGAEGSRGSRRVIKRTVSEGSVISLPMLGAGRTLQTKRTVLARSSQVGLREQDPEFSDWVFVAPPSAAKKVYSSVFVVRLLFG